MRNSSTECADMSIIFRQTDLVIGVSGKSASPKKWTPDVCVGIESIFGIGLPSFIVAKFSGLKSMVT